MGAASEGRGEQVGFAYQMSRQFIYGQIARLDKANNAQVVLQVDIPPSPQLPESVATLCGSVWA